MIRKLICLSTLLVMVSRAGYSAEVARWDFEETSGTTATDQSGQYVAILAGADTLDGEGRFGSGIDFAGDGGATLDAASSEAFRFAEDFSIVLWINSDVPVADYTRFVDMSAADGGLTDGYRLFTGSGANSDNFRFMSRQTGSNTSRIHTRDLVPDTWTLLVARHDLDGEVTMNVLLDGDPVDEAFVAGNSESWPTAGPIVYADAELKIGRLNGTSRKFDGQMDGLAFYDHILTDAEIANIFNKPPASKALAASPKPDDGNVDVLRDTVLNWAPGEFAQTHDVYLGTVYEDVNNASPADPRGVLVSEGQDANSLDAGILPFGQTYYWRVDEVNGPPDNTVFRGDVWSFEVEPFSIPIANITATASSTHDETMTPDKTIDGSGLDAQDLHSSQPEDMWLSGMGDSTPWIQYEFDQAYKLDEMWVWNSNQLIEGFVGLGAKDVTIETSTNGTDWTQLEATPQFAQAPGQDGYAHNTTVNLGGVTAQYVRLTMTSGYGMLPQRGLSEVRFFYIPTQAREPQPEDGATNVPVDTILTWRAGREAASHEVYLGTDSANLALLQTTDDPSAAIGPLDYATTYFWQVIEVNDVEDPASNAGAIWSFSTPAYGVVDDFEKYDNDCNRIFFAWLDGLGHNGGQDVDNCNVAPYNGNGTGSIVGHGTSPFAEQTIVYAGGQSMPLAYDSGMSETTIALDAQDWTAGGIQTLSLHFYGAPDNSGQLYLKINNTRVNYTGLTDALQRQQWVTWNIDLAATGANLSSVSSLSLGIEGASATGMLYVDEIRLYPLPPQTVEPVVPNADDPNLVAYYAFEGDASDTRGNYPGTAEGDPMYTTGKVGQAISLDELDDDVVYTFAQEAVWPAYTVSLWVRTDLMGQDTNSSLFNNNSSSSDFQIDTDGSNPGAYRYHGTVDGLFGPVSSSWVHIGLSCDGTQTRLYYNGLWTQTINVADTNFGQLAVGINRGMANWFGGVIDEVRIYDRALSSAEIAGIAGITRPVDRPFESE